MAIEIILHGVKMTVTKDQLFELAANGGITKDTPVNVSGKMVAAKKIKGLVFGTEEIQQRPTPSVAVPHVASAPPVTNVVPYLERDSRSDIAIPSDRLIAHLLDGLYMLLLLYPFGLYVYICPLFLMVAVGTAGIGLVRGSIITTSQLVVYGLFVLVAGAIMTWIWLVVTNRIRNYWTFYFSKGTTLGKRRRGLYIVDAQTGEAPSVSKLLIRNIIGKWFISPLIFSLGYIWILVDQNNQSWHDKFVDTIVVKKEPDPIPYSGFMPIFGYRVAAIITAVCSFCYLLVFGITVSFFK